MNCDDVKRQLVDLLYGELAADAQRSVQSHLAGCDTCRAEWDALHRTHALLDAPASPLPLGEDPTPLPPPPQGDGPGERGAATAINVPQVFRVIAERRDRSRRRWRLGTVAAGLTAAGLMLVVGLGVRVDVSAGHIVIAWKGAPMPIPAPRHETDELRARLDEQGDRIASVEELAGLAAQEVLAVDRRHSNELADLRQQLVEVDRLRRQLGAFQRQNDERWRLIANELLNRDAAVVTVVPNVNHPLTEQGVQP